MHAAEHRALRELFATARSMAQHWRALHARGLGGGALPPGADAAAMLAEEVRSWGAERGLAIGPAARSAGFSLGGARSGVGDRFLERNQALRLAVLDAAHVALALDYVGALDPSLQADCERWAARLRDHEAAARGAVVTLAGEPDAAIERVDASPRGRAAHGMANAVGTLGEWTDSKLRR